MGRFCIKEYVMQVTEALFLKKLTGLLTNKGCRIAAAWRHTVPLYSGKPGIRPGNVTAAESP